MTGTGMVTVAGVGAGDGEREGDGDGERVGDGDGDEVVSSSDFNAPIRFRISNKIALISAALPLGGADASLRIAKSVKLCSSFVGRKTRFSYLLLVYRFFCERMIDPQSLLLLLRHYQGSLIYIQMSNRLPLLGIAELAWVATKINSLKFFCNILDAISFVKTILIDPESSYNLEDLLDCL